MTELEFDPGRTALVLIDLQNGIVGRPTLAPRSGPQVVANAVRLSDAFRRAGGLVVRVNVAFAADGADAVKVPTDASLRGPGPIAPDFAEFVAECRPQSGDLVITKHQWGAFYGTELDLQLRRRGIGTIVLAGIATNFGVESTARDAFERGYGLIFVEDAMTSLSAEGHAFACKTILPLLGRVRGTDEVLVALTGP